MPTSRSSTGHTETRSGTDELLVNVFRLGREDKFRQPILQIEIVGDAAKERHRGVRVCIYQARNDGFAGSVDGLCCPKASSKVGGGANLDDFILVDRYGTVLDHAPVLIHRNDGSAHYEKVNREFNRLFEGSSRNV